MTTEQRSGSQYEEIVNQPQPERTGQSGPYQSQQGGVGTMSKAETEQRFGVGFEERPGFGPAITRLQRKLAVALGSDAEACKELGLTRELAHQIIERAYTNNW